jgi:hypothetical protein
MVREKQLASGERTEIVQRARGYTACTSAEITSSTAGSGVRCQQAKNALVLRSDDRRLRSEISVMLARTSGFDPPSRRARRTSQGMSRPVESRWIHSNTCDSPAAASLMCWRGALAGCPSG